MTRSLAAHGGPYHAPFTPGCLRCEARTAWICIRYGALGGIATTIPVITINWLIGA